DQRPQQRALARAVQADQGRDLAAPQPRVHAAQDVVAAQPDVQAADRHQVVGHFRLSARRFRFSRIFLSYQPAPAFSSSPLSAVSSGSISTSATVWFFFRSSSWSTRAEVVLGYCGSTAMTRTFSSTHFFTRLVIFGAVGSSPGPSSMTSTTVRP